MPKVLSQRQIEQFYEEGFISPVDVMSEDEAMAYKAKLDRAERDYPEHINPQNRNNLHLVLTFLNEIVNHPIIVGAVEDLIGEDIKLWGSVLFSKPPASKGFVSWHQDGTYMGITPNDFVTPWLALTHSNRENGCMTMIPGSHRDEIRQHNDTFEEDNILTRGQVIRDVDVASGVDLILKPGQMSIHHAQIIHGSQPNPSSEARVGYAIQGYMPAHSRQFIGENYWMPVRGDCLCEGDIELQSPQSDMDAAGIASRARVNDNWATILYEGAEKKRAY